MKTPNQAFFWTRIFKAGYYSTFQIGFYTGNLFFLIQGSVQATQTEVVCLNSEDDVNETLAIMGANLNNFIESVD